MAAVQVQFGGKGGRTFKLETNEDLVVVRTRDSGPVEDSALSAAGRRVLTRMEPMVRFATAGVEVFHVRSASQGDRDTIRTTLKAEPAIRFAGRVLADPVYKPSVPWTAAEATPKEPVLYSENLFVKFADGHSGRAARALLSRGTGG